MIWSGICSTSETLSLAFENEVIKTILKRTLKHQEVCFGLLVLRALRK